MNFYVQILLCTNLVPPISARLVLHYSLKGTCNGCNIHIELGLKGTYDMPFSSDSTMIFLLV
jgi:hypothetical protein